MGPGIPPPVIDRASHGDVMPTPATPSVRRASSARRVAFTGLLAAGLLALAPGGASAATPYGTNLVKNPGAENGLQNWSQFNDPKTRAYGPGGNGYPSTSERNRIGGGSRMFTAGSYNPGLGQCGELEQVFNLQGIGGAIDQGRVKAKLVGYAATSGAADLTVHIDLFFRDADNHSVASNGIQRSFTTTNEVYRKVDTS